MFSKMKSEISIKQLAVVVSAAFAAVTLGCSRPEKVDVKAERSAKSNNITNRTIDATEARIGFDTVAETDSARQALSQMGIAKFMEEVWKQGVVAPGIHSKYWVDQFAENDPALKTTELAHRDFGREVAKQLNELAAEIHLKPDRKLESERLDWLLKFAKWIRTPGKFENYRIAIRAENIATIPLLRVIVDLDVAEKDIESTFNRFFCFRDSAIMRAAIIFEESGGTLDLRSLAKKATSPEDGFEKEWIQFHKEAYQHFDNRLLRYSRDSALLKGEKVRYTFPLDDDIVVRYDTDYWDAKLHKLICVFSAQPMHLESMKKVFAFRKLTGEFPDVEVPPGADMGQTYENYYNKKFKSCWTEHKVWPGYAAIYYTHVKKNSYADEGTLKFVASRKK